MKKRLSIVFCCAMLAFISLACSNTGKSNVADVISNDSLYMDTVGDQLSTNDNLRQYRSLNDIRFANFKDKDWIDNDYIRALRKYIDDYKNGRVRDGELGKYKDDIQGKFVIGNIEPFLLGGLFIEFIFVDQPEKFFSVWVYSDVDKQKKMVIDYSVRKVELEDEKSGFTSKQQILDLLKEHPEYKMW